MKRISHYFSILTIIIILFTNCEKEDNEIISVTNETSGISKSSFSEMIKDPVFESKIQEYSSLFDGNGKNYKSSQNQSTVDTTQILKTVDNTIIYYSLKVHNQSLSTNELENLVLKKDGTIVDAFVIKWNKKTKKVIDIYEDEYLYNSLGLSTKSATYYGCVKVEPLCFIDDSSGHPADAHDCVVGGYAIDFSGCGGGGSPGGGWQPGDPSDPGSDPGDGSSGGGDGDGRGGGGQIGVISGYNRITSQINGYYQNNLEDSTLQWLESNPIEALDVSDFLSSNNSTEDLVYVLEALEVLEDGGEVDFDEQVIIEEDFKNNDCLKSVYDDMGKATKFKEYLQNFEPEFSVAHLRLRYDENFGNNYPDATSALAITEPPLGGVQNNVADYNIDITFNGDANLNASIHNKPKLIIAVSFIHEMIHAEVFRKMLAAAQTGDLNIDNMTPEQQVNYINNLRNNFEGIFDYYVERYKPNWGHEQMAQHYIGIITDAIKQYDDSQHTQVQYEAIAWLGLEGTTAWNSLTQDQRDAITQTRTNFINNDTNKCD